MEYTTVYTPEENSVAKRFNRTIIQMTRAMITWSERPQRFWAEAACTANYLRNFLPAGQDNLSPNELWDGHKPEINHLRTFGCLVHVHIHSETGAKLDRVSFQGIFVGHHSDQQVRVIRESIILPLPISSALHCSIVPDTLSLSIQPSFQQGTWQMTAERDNIPQDVGRS